jgi:hypothetical protein
MMKEGDNASIGSPHTKCVVHLTASTQSTQPKTRTELTVSFQKLTIFRTATARVSNM